MFKHKRARTVYIISIITKNLIASNLRTVFNCFAKLRLRLHKVILASQHCSNPLLQVHCTYNLLYTDSLKTYLADYPSSHSVIVFVMNFLQLLDVDILSSYLLHILYCAIIGYVAQYSLELPNCCTFPSATCWLLNIPYSYLLHIP